MLLRWKQKSNLCVHPVPSIKSPIFLTILKNSKFNHTTFILKWCWQKVLLLPFYWFTFYFYFLDRFTSRIPSGAVIQPQGQGSEPGEAIHLGHGESLGCQGHESYPTPKWDGNHFLENGGGFFIGRTNPKAALVWFDNIEVVLEHIGCPLDLWVRGDGSSGGLFLLYHQGAVVLRRQSKRSSVRSSTTSSFL